MAERDDSEKANGDLPALPTGTAGAPPTASEDKSGAASVLPTVESPPLLPDVDPSAPAAATAEVAPAIPAVKPPSAADKPQADPESEIAAPPAWRNFARLRLTRRQRRNALRAATVAFALFAGAGYGMILGGSFAAKEQPKPPPDTAAIAERKAMQEQLEKLSSQVAGLKSELERASKATQTKIAKIAGRLDSVTAVPAAAPSPAPAPAPEVTGSIPPAKSLAEVPLPRPAPQIAAPLSRPVVVPGWHVREAIDGYVYVQWRGEIFEVVPGAPLPGLGRVRSVRREGGRWVVETPKGIIVSLRDRRHFE